ncbi:MAG: transglutaminase family protein [Desulfococcaceae bacterium]
MKQKILHQVIAAKTPPPFLMGASLLFWGWQSGLLIIAVFMSLILETVPHIRIRWDFSPREFNRISDFCALIFIGMAVYLFLLHRSVYIIFTLLEWLPMSFFPLILAQNFNIRGETDISAISLLMRKQKIPGKKDEQVTVNLNWPYFALSILCTGFANVRDDRFYLGVIFLSAWALLSIRPRRFSPLLWTCLYLMICAGGYAGHLGLSRLQQIVETKGLEWFYNLERLDTDPWQSVTAIGYIGSLKPSNRILFRARPDGYSELPILLREASYNKYNFSKWFSGSSEFAELEPETDGSTWNLGDVQKNYKKMEVSLSLKKGRGMLKLPTGAFRIENLPVMQASRNLFGAVKVNEGPGLAVYNINWGPQSVDSPPEKDDLLIPEKEQPAVFRTAKELGLAGADTEEVMKILENFFTDRFSYSLHLNPGQFPTPLADFLVRSRTGHCEYFATATVLLLRAAGIPARYATGFSAHEYSSLEDQILVRDRHAHAWALAWHRGSWKDIDNTPGTWRPDEEESASSWHFIGDLWSWMVFRFSLWQWHTDKEGFSNYLIWLIIPLMLVPARRLWQKKRIRTLPEPGEKSTEISDYPGKDSPFYQIENRLIGMGFERKPGLPLFRYIRETAFSRGFHQTSLLSAEKILDIHYRYRFDPKGIAGQEKEQMEVLVRNWMDKLNESGQKQCG